MTQPLGPGSSEVVTVLVDAAMALNDAVSKVMADMDGDGVPSRTGMAMLRDATDRVKRSVTEVGKLRRK